MANIQLAQLLEIPIPEGIPFQDLDILRKQANSDFGSKDFLMAKAKLIKFGIPENIPEKYFGIIAENWYENFTEVPQYEEQNQTTLDSSTLEQLGKEAEARKKQIQETIENSKKAVEEAQQKLREIKARNDEILKQLEKQKDKKLYVEIKSPTEEQFTKEEALDFDNYKEYLKSVKPEEIPEAVDKLAQEIESRVSETLRKQGYDNEDISLITENTAADIIDNLIKSDDPKYVPPTHSIAVENSFIKNPDEIKKITKDEKTQSLIKENARFTSPETLLQGYSRAVVEAAFGPKAASKIFGPKPEKLTVSISETPQPTTTETYTPYVAIRSAQMSLENHDGNLEELKQRGIEEGKRILVQDARSLIRHRLELIHPQSVAGKFLQSNKGDYILRAFGVGPQDGLSLIEKVAFNYGVPITAGVKTALWAKATTQTAISIANTGGIMQMEAFLGGATGPIATKAATTTIAKTGFKALFSKVTAALGSLATPVGAFIGWVFGELLVKIAEKIDWAKVKKFFKEVLGPLLLVGGGIMFGAPVLGLAAGGLAFGFARGATMAGIGFGIWNFFKTLGGAFVMTIATPIIVTLLVLPPLVAFIMLLINNSAYMVPPKPVAESGFGPGQGGYECTEERESTGLRRPDDSPIQTRAWEIVEDLYQGFWCFWNRSPKAPPPYFPNDEEPVFPPGYPDIFNYELLMSGGEPAGGNDLFWCTWLVQKAYTENGVPILNTLWSPDMKLDFENRGKFIEAKYVTKDNAVPGSVIFFDVENEKDRIDHVAIIYQSTEDSIVYIQSNAGLKTETLTLGSAGLQGKPGYIDVIGIGTP